jgi:hypothetical protein
VGLVKDQQDLVQTGPMAQRLVHQAPEPEHLAGLLATPAAAQQPVQFLPLGLPLHADQVIAQTRQQIGHQGIAAQGADRPGEQAAGPQAPQPCGLEMGLPERAQPRAFEKHSQGIEAQHQLAAGGGQGGDGQPGQALPAIADGGEGRVDADHGHLRS